MDWAVIVTAVIAFICYINTFNHGFVYDDNRAILSNADVKLSTPLGNLLLHDFWGTSLWHEGSHGSYRPLVTLSFRLNVLLSDGKLSPYGFHLTNVIFHSITTASYTWFIRVLVGTSAGITPWIAGLFFAIHPVHTEAVAGIVGRADVLSGMFFISSLVIYDTYAKFRQKSVIKSNVLFSLTVLLATCSMLCKENGITVLLIIPLYDALHHGKQGLINYVKRIFGQNGVNKHKGISEHNVCSARRILFSFCVLFALRLSLTRGQFPKFSVADNPVAHESSLLTRTFTFLYLPVFNLFLLLFPSTLSFDWSMNSISLIRNVLDFRNLITLIVYYIVVVFAYKQIRVIEEKSILNYHFDINANLKCNEATDSSCFGSLSHYKKHSKYSKSFGNCSFCASSEYFVEKPNRYRKYYEYNAKCILMGVAMMIVPFLPATNLLNYVGFVVAERVLYIPSMGYCLIVGHSASHLLLWGKKHIGMKLYYLTVIGLMVLFVTFVSRTLRRNMDWKDEESLYRSGIEINPAKAYGNLGNILSLQGKQEEAEKCYKNALFHRPNMADVHYNYGILLQTTERYKEAVESYNTAIKFRPKLTVAYLNLGIVLVQMNRLVEAETVFKDCSTIDGTSTKDLKTHESARTACLFQLGRLYIENDSLIDAVNALLNAVKIMPTHYAPQSVYNMLGEAYSRLGRDGDAEPWFQAALSSHIHHIPAHLTYGKLLSRNSSRVHEAELWYRRAERLAPTDPAVFRHYGQFLLNHKRYLEAASKFHRVIELTNPEYQDVVKLATSLRLAGNLKSAEIYYKRAITLNPMESSAMTNLGALYHLMERLDEAKYYYKKALELLPDDDITKENLQRIRRLEKIKTEKKQIYKNIARNNS